MTGPAAPRKEVSLDLRAPLAAAPLLRFLAAHAVPGLERVDVAAGEVTRAVPDGAGGVVPCTVRIAEDAVGLRTAAPTPGVVAAVRRWLDLDLDPALPDAALARDPDLAPLVAARPGLRVPGSVDGFETLACAVLGQQVSLAAARTFAGRLVTRWGEPAGEGLTRFPHPGVLAAAGADAVQRVVGTTRARAASLVAAAAAVAGGLDPADGRDPAALRGALLALPGVGSWTAEYVALRAARDPDAFLASDLVLLRALGVRSARDALTRAEAWRPWRGHALLHLWTREVFT